MIDENTNGQEQSAEDLFDITMIEDAGESDEMQEAAAAAQSAKINLDHRKQSAENNRAEIYQEPNLVKRARKLAVAQAIEFKYFVQNKGDFDMGMRPKPDAPLNRYAVYDALFDYGSGLVPHPHNDIFKGRLVDQHGEVMTMRSVKVRELMEALDQAGMENQKEREVAESIRNWAMDHERNSLVEFINRSIPEWDGKSRLESMLIDLFQPRDTETTRKVFKYFWLSLYNRLLHPGSLAPISLALVGGQDAGKSYFGVLLCRLLMNDPKAGPVKLDFGGPLGTFLRNITGKSIVANVGEMKGFREADLEKIKDFATRSEDDMDFKFEDSIVKPRQWITLMDSNRYDGLQRDDTGNRRFYPIFCFQQDDEFGQPTWAKGKKFDFSNFKEDLWQVFSECKLWMEEHGWYEYEKMVQETSKAVSEFSDYERKHARGLVSDDNIDTNLRRALVFTEKFKSNRGSWYFTAADLVGSFRVLSRYAPAAKFLKPHLEAIGLEAYKTGGTAAYKVETSTLKALGFDDTEHGFNKFLMLARADSLSPVGVHVDEPDDWNDLDEIINSIVQKRESGF